MKNYQKLIERSLQDHGLELYQIEGVGLDYKCIYISKNNKCIKTVQRANYKECYFKILELINKNLI